MTLVDTNVLLDIVRSDPVWADWSVEQLESASLNGPLVINDIVFAEMSVGFQAIEEVEDVLGALAVAVTDIPRAALFLASKVFQRYRASGGTRTGVLPDFFIGAHAAVANLPLITRDARRYRTYFPTVDLLTPWH